MRDKTIVPNFIIVITLLVVVLLFFAQIASVGISTHDELLNIFRVRLGQYFDKLSWDRWGMTLLGFIPSYIQGLCTSTYLYRFFTVFAVVVSCFSFAWLIKKLANKETAILFLFLFFLLAQIEPDHDGLFAFSFSYQLNTCFVFVSLALFVEYFQSDKKVFLVLSAFCFLLSSMAYEAFILYGLLFLLIAIAQLRDQGRLSFLALIKSLWLHVLLVSLYVISYFIVKMLIGVDNPDSSVGTNISINAFLYTLWNLSIGLFPLNYRYYSLSDLLSRSLELTVSNISFWAVIIAVMVIFAILIPNASKLSNKSYLRITLLCFTGMVLPGCLIAITAKFTEWIYYTGANKSFGTSYYSYFFIILWIAVSIVYIYQKIPAKKVFLLVSLTCLAFVISFTGINNQYYVKQFSENEVKYELWDKLVSTQAFFSVDNNAVVYAPDYIGIHNNIETLAQYANYYSGKNITVTNKQEELNFQNATYYAIIDKDTESIYFSQINSSFVTNETYVCSLYSLGSCAVMADRINSNDTSPLLVNGIIENYYAANVRTKALLIPESEVRISCNNMEAQSYKIIRTADAYSNGVNSVPKELSE